MARLFLFPSHNTQKEEIAFPHNNWDQAPIFLSPCVLAFALSLASPLSSLLRPLPCGGFSPFSPRISWLLSALPFFCYSGCLSPRSSVFTSSTSAPPPSFRPGVSGETFSFLFLRYRPCFRPPWRACPSCLPPRPPSVLTTPPSGPHIPYLCLLPAYSGVGRCRAGGGAGRGRRPVFELAHAGWPTLSLLLRTLFTADFYYSSHCPLLCFLARLSDSHFGTLRFLSCSAYSHLPHPNSTCFLLLFTSWPCSCLTVRHRRGSIFSTDIRAPAVRIPPLSSSPLAARH